MKSLILLVLICFVFGNSSYANNSSEQALSLGRSAESQGHLQNAAQFYRTAALSANTNEQATISLARVLIASHDYDEAMLVLKEYLKISNPFHIEAHLLLSEVYFRKDMLSDGMTEITTVKKLRPGNAKSAELEGMFHFKMGKVDKSIEILTAVLKAEPTNVNARFYRARSYASSNNWSAANLDFKFLVDEFPSNIEYQNLFAESFIKLSKWADAENVLNHILKINSKDITALLNLSEVYNANNHHDEKIAIYKRLIEIDSANIEVSQKLADTYIQLKRYKLAEDELLRQLKINVANESAAKKLVSIWSEQNRYDLVGVFLKEYCERSQKSIWASGQYVQSLVRIANYNLALEYVDKAPKENGEAKANFKILAGYIHFKEGKIDESIKDLLSAEDKSPKNSTVQFNLGVAYSAVKNYSSAKIHYLKISDKNPQYSKAQANLAFINQAASSRLPTSENNVRDQK